MSTALIVACWAASALGGFGIGFAFAYTRIDRRTRNARLRTRLTGQRGGRP